MKVYDSGEVPDVERSRASMHDIVHVVGAGVLGGVVYYDPHK